jgi:hypothetical protein
MKNRLLVAMLCYAVLAVLAGLTLKDFPAYPFRSAVWVLLAALALMTWVTAFRRE